MAWRFAPGAGLTTSGHMSGLPLSPTTSPSSPASSRPDQTPWLNPAPRPVCRRIELASLLFALHADQYTFDRKIRPSSPQDHHPHRRHITIPQTKTIIYGRTLARLLAHFLLR